MRKDRNSWMHKMGLRKRLSIILLACGLVPLGIAAGVSYFTAQAGLSSVREDVTEDARAKVVASLTAVQALKKAQIEHYFSQIGDQVVTFSENRMVVDARRGFKDSFLEVRKELQVSPEELAQMRAELTTYYTNDFNSEYGTHNDGKQSDSADFFTQLDDDSVVMEHKYIKSNPQPLGSKHFLDVAKDGTVYAKLHALVHPVIRSYLDRFGYYDIFLVDIESGDIVYSVFKELDYSTSLINGAFAKTNFGDAFRKAAAATKANETFLVDFKQYAPSYEAPASFIASPIFDGDKKIGVALFQMPVDRVTTIMGVREGMGETGETILVGADYLMRSDSHRDPKNHSLDAAFRRPETGKVETAATRAALDDGETGSIVTTDYAGNEALICYGPVDLLGIKMCLNAKQDTSEAFASIARVQEVSTAAG